MKVIILETGEIKEVSLGYGVNYLLPKKLAVMATKKRVEEIKLQKKQKQTEEKSRKFENRQLSERLDGKVVKLKVEAGKKGKIHGSITKKDIAKELKILKTQVGLNQPIKKLGDYEVGLKFGKAKARIKVKVVSKNEKK